MRRELNPRYGPHTDSVIQLVGLDPGSQVMDLLKEGNVLHALALTNGIDPSKWPLERFEKYPEWLDRPLKPAKKPVKPSIVILDPWENAGPMRHFGARSFAAFLAGSDGKPKPGTLPVGFASLDVLCYLDKKKRRRIQKFGKTRGILTVRSVQKSTGGEVVRYLRRTSSLYGSVGEGLDHLKPLDSEEAKRTDHWEYALLPALENWAKAHGFHEIRIQTHGSSMAEPEGDRPALESLLHYYGRLPLQMGYKLQDIRNPEPSFPVHQIWQDGKLVHTAYMQCPPRILLWKKKL